MDLEILEKEVFEQERANYLYFLKESILNGDYVVNPKAIVAHWLMGTVNEQVHEECPVD